jgi:hypothetical protein
MGYNHANAFQTTLYCPKLLKEISVAALIKYRQDTNGPGGEGVQVKLHTLHKIAEVAGDSFMFYTWAELGFTV